MNKSNEKGILNNLVEIAIKSGASEASIIPSTNIIVREDLANLCQNDPKCENYGMSYSCPPYVQGPSGFREWQKKSRYAIVLKIDIPSSVMFSNERREVMQLLTEIASTVEHKSIEMGYTESKAFSGGSCKNLFCSDYETCQRISDQGKCRNPQVARPSMSGFGIDVTQLMHSAGWSAKKANSKDSESMTWLAALVLII